MNERQSGAGRTSGFGLKRKETAVPLASYQWDGAQAARSRLAASGTVEVVGRWFFRGYGEGKISPWGRCRTIFLVGIDLAGGPGKEPVHDLKIIAWVLSSTLKSHLSR